jgi:hypothetical protein
MQVSFDITDAILTELKSIIENSKGSMYSQIWSKRLNTVAKFVAKVLGTYEMLLRDLSDQKCKYIQQLMNEVRVVLTIGESINDV